MKKARIFTTALSLLLTAAVLAGCTNGGGEGTSSSAMLSANTSSAAPSKATGQASKVRIAINSDPQDLSPWNGQGGSKPYVYYEIYENLFDLENNEYVPVLAKSWKKVDDLHYDVTIYDNIYDSAGNHITADDIVFDYDTLIKSGYAVRYDIFKSIKKLDDYTVEFTWTSVPSAVGILEFPWCRTNIFSQKAYESGKFATSPVATGPYVVKSFTPGSTLVLEKNPKYWQTDTSKISARHQANVNEIDYQIIAEPAQQVIALQTNKVDYADLVPAENLKDFQNGGQYSQNFAVSTSQGSMLYTVIANNSSGNPLADINLRNAVFYAINNTAAAQAGGNCIASKALGTSFFGDYVKAWESENNYETKDDADLAKQYLSKSGYKGETLKLLGGNSETEKNLLTIIQSFLTNIGINAKIVSVDSATESNYWSQAGAWDLVLANPGGGSQVGEWNRMMNNTEFSGKSLGFISDSKLQQLFINAYDASTHSNASMTACHDYYISQAYGKAICSPSQTYVYSTSKFAKVFLRENQYILPGSCTYYAS